MQTGVHPTPFGTFPQRSRRTISLDPTTTFCPNVACAARGQTGQGNIGIHSCKDKRFICTACHKTFSATNGTAFYRLRTSAKTVSLVVTLMAHGCSLQAIAGRASTPARRCIRVKERRDSSAHRSARMALCPRRDLRSSPRR